MGIKASLSKPFAKHIARRIKKWSQHPIETQQKVFGQLIKGARNTAFGKEHHFDKIKTYEDFKENIPIRDYEGIRPYIDRIIAGEKDVLWKGKPIYFCKTSGTTSGAKYIPVTRESLPNLLHSARNALLSYIAETGKAGFVNGKMIFLQGSPKLDKVGDIPLGRLSGIVANHVPAYLTKNRMPSYETNCIEDWEAKVDAIVEETLKEDMTLISGIPSWVQMYFDRLLEKSGKEKIIDIFPNFSLFVHGGVNYEPYRTKFESTIGKKIDTIETYPASEGFFAFQDSLSTEGLLLILNKGIFYEFIPADEFLSENPTRISLKDVELEVNYAIILNTKAGLWGYSIGDTVKFVSKNPYRLVVTGRIAHYTSAFGEHVIVEEVENALKKAIVVEGVDISEDSWRAGSPPPVVRRGSGGGVEIIEFHIAPQVNPPADELPYHEWFIEFGKKPEDINAFRLNIDEAMQEKNIYYKDLITGNILQPLKITPIKKGGFINFMKAKGKLGGQNKVPRLTNDRNIADELTNFAE